MGGRRKKRRMRRRKRRKMIFLNDYYYYLLFLFYRILLLLFIIYHYYYYIFQKAKLFSQQIGAAAYVECSAKTGKNLQNVFTTAVEVGLMDDPPLPHLTPSGMTVKRAR